MTSHPFVPSATALESRNLLATLSLQGTSLVIYADETGQTVAEVRYADDSQTQLIVSIDGVESTIAADAVDTIVFVGGQDGSDVFFNDTFESSLAVIYGPWNTIQGGWGHDVVIDFSEDSSVEDLDGDLDYFDMVE